MKKEKETQTFNNHFEYNQIPQLEMHIIDDRAVVHLISSGHTMKEASQGLDYLLHKSKQYMKKDRNQKRHRSLSHSEI